MTRSDDELLAYAQRFLDDDPDPSTRAELTELIARRDLAELAERFAGPLTFGTAGLRGVLGAGESRMNRRVVAQITAGLCTYLERTFPDAKTRGVCVGRDARRQSPELADEVIAVCTGHGFVVHVFDEVIATPILAFSVRDRNAVVGVMITASHNPPAYNGYKVYFEDGAQLLSPHDEGIAEAAAAIPSVLSLPRSDTALAQRQGLRRGMPGVVERYFESVHALVGTREPSEEDLRIVYTALHGVGDRFTQRALSQAGFHDVRSVAAQATPDGSFPTVAFPNPEEPGAMDLALALAQDERADLVIANDPDADRLAVGARDGHGDLRMLTGNETGVLLADYLLSRRSVRSEKDLVLSTIVSTPLLHRIAESHGVHGEETLTGFKWIMKRARELEREQGLRFLFGFEEALGFAAGTDVRDKDGIACAALAARMAHEHARRGHTLIDALHDLYRKHGYFDSTQVSLVMAGQSGMTTMRAAMTQLSAFPPVRIGEHDVCAVSDLARGLRIEGGVETPLPLPESNVLIFELAGGHRLAVRPSGTEPKLKLYVDVRVPMRPTDTIDDASAAARAQLRDLALAAKALVTSAASSSSVAHKA